MGTVNQRYYARKRGEATYRIVRYADDFVICVAGTRRHADALVTETAQVLRPLGLTLSKDKTRITHIDEGFDFLGWRVKRDLGRRGRPGISAPVHLAPGRRMAATQAPQAQLALAATPPPSRLVAERQGDGALQPGGGQHHPYRYRAARIETPWQSGRLATHDATAYLEQLQPLFEDDHRHARGEPDAGELARPVRRAAASRPPRATAA